MNGDESEPTCSNSDHYEYDSNSKNCIEKVEKKNSLKKKQRRKRKV
ncbi:MAG: hypothetical protein LBB45_08475 [Methanobrevibacter sp.]|jgi:hypothetical protein|nr:hypothetical protein [Candidatus Methanovirga basalitermitum]